MTDLALYRQDCTNGSTWYIRDTYTKTDILADHKYGGCHDIPAPGDYNGDGSTDLALYRQDCTNGSTWWVQNSRTLDQILADYDYGGCHDIPAT